MVAIRTKIAAMTFVEPDPKKAEAAPTAAEERSWLHSTAFWAVLGPDVEFRRTPFDTERSAGTLLASDWPEAQSFVAENVRAAVPREEAITLFEQIAVERGER